MVLDRDSNPRVQFRFAVFRLFLGGQTRTREEAVALTGRSRSTIVKVFQELRDLGAIHLVGQRASRGGRPHELYGLDPSFRMMLSADFAIPELSVAVSDLAGALHCRTDAILASNERLTPTRALDRLHSELEGCLERSGVARDRILCLNVSIPGPVIGGRSTIQNREVDDWFDVRLGEELERRTDFRTFVTNDVVNMMTTELDARGEMGTAASAPGNTLYLALRRSSANEVRVGAAFTVEAGGAFAVHPGSVSHHATGVSTALCRCGNRGCLERALQDLPQPTAVGLGVYHAGVADLLTPVLHSLCRFTEARRVILDLSGAGDRSTRLHELVESRLRMALGRGPLHDTVVESAVAVQDAPLRGAALNGLQRVLLGPSPAVAIFGHDDPTWGKERTDQNRHRPVAQRAPEGPRT